jgi:ZIP family zinc transporter
VAEAVVFGLIASGALVLGGAVGSYWPAPRQITGIMLAFASGTLISALSFELFTDAVEGGGVVRAAFGLLLGGATFVIANTALDSRLAPPEADQREVVESGSRGWAGRCSPRSRLDGVPENLALGVSLLGGDGSLALLVAIFASNFPESLVGAIEMRKEGRSPRFAIGIWLVAAVLLAAAVVLGRGVLSGAGETTLSFFTSFAGGAVLASLADTLMPEAFEHGKPWNSFATAAGFVLSFVLAG